MTKKDYIAIAEIIKTKLDQDEITETSLIFKFIQRIIYSIYIIKNITIHLA